MAQFKRNQVALKSEILQKINRITKKCTFLTEAYGEDICINSPKNDSHLKYLNLALKEQKIQIDLEKKYFSGVNVGKNQIVLKKDFLTAVAKSNYLWSRLPRLYNESIAICSYSMSTTVYFEQLAKVNEKLDITAITRIKEPWPRIEIKLQHKEKKDLKLKIQCDVKGSHRDSGLENFKNQFNKQYKNFLEIK